MSPNAKLGAPNAHIFMNWDTFSGSGPGRSGVGLSAPIDAGWLQSVGAGSLRLLGNHTRASGSSGDM